MKKGILAAIATIAVVLCVLAGYAGTEAQTTSAPSKTIAQTAQENGDLSTLVTALKAAGLVDALNGPGPFTVFAPTNEAFAKLDPALLQKLTTTDVATLKQILLYHVVAGQVCSNQLQNGQVIKTLEGSTLKVTINETGVFIDNAKVVTPDVQASNGVVHVIDTVLIPPDLTPASAPAPSSCQNTSSSAGQTIAQIAAATPELSTLVTALKAAGLVDALNGPGPFTVFAPTNEAFAKLDPALLQKLTTTDVATLKQILLYHVASGEVPSSQLMNGQQITTLQGQKVVIGVGSNCLSVNGALVLVKDIQASNGVIHIIDSVLIPPAAGGC